MYDRYGGDFMTKEELELFKKFSTGMKSKKSYAYTLSELKSVIGDKDLLLVKSDDINKYLDTLNKNGQSKTTIRRKYHQLFSFYNFLLDEMLIESNPLKKVPTPKASKQIKMERTLTFDNLKVLLEVLENYFPYRDYVFTLLLATTGIRQGEGLNLKWSDFFIDDNNLVGAIVSSGSRKRYVRIFDFVWKELDNYRKDILQVDESYLKEDYYIFIGEKQLSNYRTYPASVKPVTGDWMRKTYVKACEIADIPLVTAKDIRHTYTMLTMKLGLPADDIKEQVGWSSTDFLNRYHGVVEQLNAPINKYVEEFFKDIKN